jgi:hypothetical protein
VTSGPLGSGPEASADEEETGLTPSEVPDGVVLATVITYVTETTCPVTATVTEGSSTFVTTSSTVSTVSEGAGVLPAATELGRLEVEVKVTVDTVLDVVTRVLIPQLQFPKGRLPRL